MIDIIGRLKKIGIGYDGVDDEIENDSSVRGHLLLLEDEVLGTRIYDDFNDNSKNTNIWDTDSIGGSTAISETGGEVKISNPGTGTTGYSYRPTTKKFGKSLIIEAEIGVTNGEAGGDGQRCEAYIELYKDTNNYFQFGLYRDTSEAINSRGYVTHNIAAAGEATDDVDATDLDNVARRYIIIIDEHNVHVYLDSNSNLLGTYAFEGLTDYTVRLVAGSELNGDKIDIKFDDFKIVPYYERLRELYSKLLSIQGGSESLQTLHDDHLEPMLDLARSGDSGTTAMTGSEQTLYEESSTTPFAFEGGNIDLTNECAGDSLITRLYKKIKSGGSYIKFGESNFDNAQDPAGTEVSSLPNQYSVKVTAEQDASYGVEGADTEDGGAFANETAVANNAAANDMNLLPVGGEAVDDAYYFGGHYPFSRLKLNVGTAGSTATTDWVFAYEYWDGASWTALSGVTDGTDMFRTAGSNWIVFTKPSDWAETNDGGNLSAVSYWMRMRVTTTGTGAFVQPLGTQAWIYMDIDHEWFDSK